MNSSKIIREDSIDSSEFEGISQRTEHHKRRSKPKGHHFQYICAICGDKALGYNFNAVTCESCKAFFRRNALRTKNMRCAFTGECTLTPFTRKFCPACRLSKCFSVGMKKQWILTEEQLQKRRVKIEYKRKTSRDRSDDVSESAIFSPGISRFENTPPSYSYNYQQMNKHLYSPALGTNSTISPGIQRHHSFSNSILPPMHKNSFSFDMSYFPPTSGHYSHYYPVPKTPKDSGFYDFVFAEEFEGDYLKSIDNFASHLIIKFAPQLPPFSSSGEIFDTTPKVCLSEEANQMIENINYISYIVFVAADNVSAKIKQLVDFIKHFEEYRNLNQEDRHSLLRSSLIVFLAVRLGIVTDSRDYQIPSYDSMLSPTPIDHILNSCKATKELAEHSAGDVKALQLLILIAIFSPEKDNLSNMSLVVKTQEHYTYLLSLYLQSHFNRFQARTMFINLINDLQFIKFRAMNNVKMLELSNNNTMTSLYEELSSLTVSPN